MSKKVFLIYKYTSPSGKSYIGQTKNHRRRITAHKSINSRCTAFSAAIKKYGWNNFKHEVLCECETLEEANRIEEELIAEHGTLSPNGYNLLSGGKNRIPSIETLKKLKASKQNISAETKAKISKSKKGVKASDEARKRISIAQKGRIHTEEARLKLSEAHKGKIVSVETRQKMSFAKCNISLETREKMSFAAKKRICSPETIAKRAKALQGRIVSEETKIKISASLNGHGVTDETRKRMSESAKKKVITPETRAKMTATRKANFEAKRLSIS